MILIMATTDLVQSSYCFCKGGILNQEKGTDFFKGMLPN